MVRNRSQLRRSSPPHDHPDGTNVRSDKLTVQPSVLTRSGGRDGGLKKERSTALVITSIFEDGCPADQVLLERLRQSNDPG